MILKSGFTRLTQSVVFVVILYLILLSYLHMGKVIITFIITTKKKKLHLIITVAS
jgi:hypothetical protein